MTRSWILPSSSKRSPWREMNADPQTKIGRPQQLYTGAPERTYPGV